MAKTYIALLHKDADSVFTVTFPDLPGCLTAGDSLEEARANAAEALALHLDGLAEEGLPAPPPVKGLDEIMADPANRAAVGFLVDAPAKKPKSVPITITVTQDLDQAVRAEAAARGLTFSAFYAEGARRLLRKHHRA